MCVFEAEKCEDDMEREAQLLEWRLTLTEERNAVMVPFSGSGIPGAPAEWYVPGGPASVWPPGPAGLWFSTGTILVSSV